MIRCPACNADNHEEASRCFRCGAALVGGAALQFATLAESNILRGDYTTAQGQLDEANNLLTELVGAELLEARVRWLQGMIYYNKAMTGKAAIEVRHAMRMLEGKESAKPLLAEVLNTLGNIEYLHGKMNLAQDYYWRALQLAEQSHTQELLVKLWTNLGNVSVNEGRTYEALFRYNKAAQYADAQNNPALQVMCYRMLCYVYVVIGPIAKGMEYVRRILALLPEIENQSQVCVAMIAAGVVNRYYGDLDAAKSYLETALDIAEQSDNQVGRTDVLAKLAQVYLDKGDYQAGYAIAHYLFNDEAVPLLFKKQAAAQLVQYYATIRDFASAQECVDWILKFERQQDNDERLYLPVALYFSAMSDWNKAQQNFELAIEQSRTRGDTYELGRAYLEYARAVMHREGTASITGRQMLEQAATAFRKIGALGALATVEADLEGQ